MDQRLERAAKQQQEALMAPSPHGIIVAYFLIHSVPATVWGLIRCDSFFYYLKQKGEKEQKEAKKGFHNLTQGHEN